MKNTYIKEAIRTVEIKIMYADLFEDMNTNLWIFEEGDILNILLYEDYRMFNNAFSEIISFPSDVTFSLDKLSWDEDILYNIWEIKIPTKLIYKLIEEYNEEEPEHYYEIILNNGDKISITGKICWFSNDGSIRILDSYPDVENALLNHCDIYNKIEISNKISAIDVKLSYLKKERERLLNYMDSSISLKSRYSESREDKLNRINNIDSEIAEIESTLLSDTYSGDTST